MQSVLSRILGFAFALVSVNAGLAANFGTVVPVHGAVSDIALDERRGHLYAANFGAYRVEVMDIYSKTLLAPLPVPMPPSAVALTPDNRYLVVGEYQKPDPTDPTQSSFTTESGGFTVFDLDGNTQYSQNMGTPVLAVAIGADGKALILTRTPVSTDPQNPGPTTNLFLLDPVTRVLTGINSITIQSVDLPVKLATFPTQIIQAAAGVSGDRNIIQILAATEADTSGTSRNSILIHYDVRTGVTTADAWISSPPQGPRSVSVDQNGTNVMSSWSLFHYIQGRSYLWAQLPAANGAFNLGSHAWDTKRNLIYLQVPAPGDGAVLHVMDTDNLTVRERIQLQEQLSGKSVMSSDMYTMYSASQSGITILPVGQLPAIPQVGAQQEDVLFAADACNRLVVKQTINIVRLGDVESDFTLSLPDGTKGITLSATSGTTPAQVEITIDPTAFQGSKGTSVVPLTITSSAAVNLPPAVRLLINTRDFSQRGQIVDIPGTLVDLLADPARGRLYILRQDKNLVLVYDMVTMQQLANLRTGNTPTQMAMTTDGKYLIVGNDNSQIANVFDLDTFLTSDPILLPGGDYARSFGVANNAIFALIRPAGEQADCLGGTPAGLLDQVDFVNRTATTPCTLSAGTDPSVFKNILSTADGTLASTPGRDYLLLALADGTVAQYDDSAQTWVLSRKDDLKQIPGAYHAFSGNLFLVGANLLDAALVPLGDPFPDTDGTSSGAGVLNGAGLRTTAAGPTDPGTIQRIDLTNLNEYNATAMVEAPLTKDTMLRPLVGQIGESVLPYTRTLAVSADQTQIYSLSISGLTILTSTFDAVLAKPVISSVTNPADHTTAVAVGGVVDINGAALASTAVSAGAPPLPSSLGEVCAMLGTTALPLFSVSPTQLVAQLPYVSGTGSLVIHTPGGISDPFSLSVPDQAPAIFRAIRNDNGEVVNFTNPIHPNTEITIYLTGLGLTTPLPALGTAAPADPLAQVNVPPTVKLGNTNMAVTSANLVPGEIGVYQVVAKAPSKVQPGKSVPLTVQAGGTSATLQVRVVSP